MAFASATLQGFSFDNDPLVLVLDHHHRHDPEPRNPSPSANQPRASVGSSLLSPFLSPATTSDCLSPSANHVETPAGSASTLSYYQSSDFSDLDEDPFFGANFISPEAGTPSFLDDHSVWGLTLDTTTPAELQCDAGANSLCLLTPEQPASSSPSSSSIHALSPGSDQPAFVLRPGPDRLPDSISPQQLQKPFRPHPLVIPAPQLTPSESASGRSSDDCLMPAPVDMRCQSPRVTISVWDKDHSGPVHAVERTFEDSSTTVRGGIESAGDLISSTKNHEQSCTSVPRGSVGQWRRDPATGLSGLDPNRRPGDEIASINEIVSRRETEERNQEVGKWLLDNIDEPSLPREKTPEELRAIEEADRSSNDNVPLGDHTENRYIPGQTYFFPGNGGQMTDEDFDIIHTNRNWADAPVLHLINTAAPGQHQPPTSQAAIERFERMCRDNDSIISRAATWGTRRRSLPSVMDLDIEGVTSGNFLKKLSISRGGGSNKPGSLLKDLRGLVRRPSAASMRKRSRSGQGEALFQQDEPQSPPAKRDSTPHLSPTSRTPSWGRKNAPSINTALVCMGQNFASIGTTHTRNRSISGASVAPSKSPLSGLSVKNTLRRPRSKSDLTKPTTNMETHSNLVQMWKRTGGPPVASLCKAHVDMDDDDEDDDDFYEDHDMKMDPNIIDDIAPALAGFQQHIRTLNPGLPPMHSYLVDRIAHQQISRYKQLLNAKDKHLNLGANCPCASLCLALGGSANLLDSKGDARGLDPLSTHYDEDVISPTDGVISQDSFPADIPMPPAQCLPAEFECQLCYQKKRFQKPSDWTKHVHEDIQPFTCTWDKCRDAKMFKRKADWVRHENEGHRHLEWWTCDVEDCRHTCYRRDNFLQHLVREHKFQEPKAKTKAAMKRAGSADPTWQKVEQCHVETTKQPQEEPCRFCSKLFPTWKKLTVHLAKHMEQIALPVLRLVTARAKELAAEAIVSPTQDAPLRPKIALPMDQKSPASDYSGDARWQVRSTPQQVAYSQSQSPFIYPVMPPRQFQQPFCLSQFDIMEQTLHQQPPTGAGSMNQEYGPNQGVQDLPVTSASYVQGPDLYMTMSPNQAERFSPLNALGLQTVAGPPMGGQMGYDTMMDPSSGIDSPFSGHETLSTYSPSPHTGASNSDRVWDDRQMSGFP